jgi:hypothetical protein
MNLQENIHRIKQMMGINESNLTTLKRRLSELPTYVKSAYTWLYPSAFRSFDDFLERVVFSTTRDFSSSDWKGTYDELLSVREKLQPFVKQYILDNLINEIREYYEKG